MQKFPRWQIIGLAGLIAILIVGGIWFYKTQEQAQQKQIQESLLSIARLKAGQISEWRRERLSDAMVLMESQLFIMQTIRWFRHSLPGDEQWLRNRLLSLKKHYQYSDIFLVKPNGTVCFSLDRKVAHIGPESSQSLQRAFDEHQPVIVDIHEDEGESGLHVSVVIPVYAPGGNASTPEGAIVLVSKADQFLFPLIQSWPVPSETAETLLVRRDGNDALFLNELRHKHGTALRMRIGLDRKEVPAVQALLGRTGIFEGRDYRGHEVISVLLPIEGTPWYLVTKMDKTEAFAGWRYRSFTILALLSGAILLICFAGLLMWQHAQKDLYEAKYLAEAALRSAEKRHSIVLQSIGDAVLVTDDRGQIELFNPRAEKLTGWMCSEAAGKSVREVLHVVDEDTKSALVNPVEQVLDGAKAISWDHHKLLISRDGTPRAIDDSVSPVFDENGRLTGVVLIFRDRAPELQAQKELFQANERLELAQASARIGIWDWDAKTNISRWTRQIFDLLGLDPNVHQPSLKTWLDVVHPDDRESARLAMRQALKQRAMMHAEYRVLLPGGKIRWIYTSGKAIYDDESPMRMIGASVDVTERKKAEEQIFLSIKKWQTTFDSIYDAIALLDEHCTVVQCNQAFATLTGREATDIIGSKCFALMHSTDSNIEDCPFLRAQKSLSREVMELNIGQRIYNVIVDPIVDRSYQFAGAVHILQDITGQKQMEAALRESEEQYRVLFETSPHGILVADIETRQFVYANPAICSMLGYPQEILCRMAVADIHPMNTIPLVMKEFQALAEGKKKVVAEIPCLRKDGSIFYANISGAVTRINGRLCNIGFFTDVTEQKKADEKLRESEERYRMIFEGSPNGILITDAQTRRHVYANPAVCSMLGYTAEELKSMSFTDIYPEAIRAQALEDFSKQARDQKTTVYNIPCIRKDKTVIFADISGTKTVLDGRECNVGFFTDVTERKKAEERLRDAFRTSDDIIQKIPSGLFIYQYSEPDRLHLIGGNPAAERLTGLQIEKIRGWEFNEIFPMARASGLTDQFLKVIKTGLTYETEDVEYDDEKIHGAFRIRAFGLPGERLAVAFENITERKRMEQEREKLQAQLVQAQKMESVGRLAGGVAHDFNNMLSIIIGHAELGLAKIRPDEPLHADLLSINKAAKRSADLTRQLLAFARKQTIAPKVIDLNDTIVGTLKMLRRLIGEEIDLIWIPGASLWPVMLDPGQIDQLLANLCINARDAIVSTGKITIETQNIHFSEDFCRKHTNFQPGDYVLLAVGDSGSGMDEETLRHLFEPFFTTKEIGRGTGLGLATVYGIVKQNAGFISVESEAGKGSVFHIYLPRHKGEAVRESDEHEGLDVEQGQGVILLVEDEPSILYMGKQMLEKLGYSVLAANSPSEAQALADRHAGAVDLLITDVVMPEMNGRDLAQLLSARYPKMKQLFMSGYTADAIAHHGVLDAGIEFIQKPFLMNELSAKIKEVLTK